VAEPDGASQAGGATVALHRRAEARSPIASWALRVGTAAALGVDAAVHWRNAPAYDAIGTTLTQGELFRVEAVLAVAVGLLVLIRPRRSSWVAALLIGASALAAVLLYRYVDVGSLGPLPDMYENTWQVPGKLLLAWAEGAPPSSSPDWACSPIAAPHRRARPPVSRLRVVGPGRDRACQHDENAMRKEAGCQQPR
jgi:hypothetical protein